MPDHFNSHGAFSFGDDIPKPGPELYIKRLDANESVQGVICSVKICSVTIHWNAKRKKSEPHFKDETKCPGCLNGMTKRWKGFLHVVCAPKGDEIFLELTPESATALKNVLGQEQSWRGNRIQVSRGNVKASRLKVTVLTRAPENFPLPPERDPAESILKLWGYRLGEDGHWHDPEEKHGEEGLHP
jgi:hypothetical protein